MTVETVWFLCPRTTASAENITSTVVFKYTQLTPRSTQFYDEGDNTPGFRVTNTTTQCSPTQRLPPPPSTPPSIPSPKQSRHDGPTISQRMGLNCTTSASSISYASSDSLPGSPYGVVERDNGLLQRSGLSHGTEPESPISFVNPPPRESSRTLKKGALESVAYAPRPSLSSPGTYSTAAGHTTRGVHGETQAAHFSPPALTYSAYSPAKYSVAASSANSNAFPDISRYF